MNRDLTDGNIPEAPEHSIELRNQISHSNMALIWSENLARTWAKALLESYFGADELARQRPLEVTDGGDCWNILGSWNRDGKIRDANSAFRMSLWKYDGRVIDFCMPYIFSEALSVLEKLCDGPGTVLVVNPFYEAQWPDYEDERRFKATEGFAEEARKAILRSLNTSSE